MTDALDSASARPPVIAIIAGVVQIAAGATTATYGLQLWLFTLLYGWMAVIPYLLIVLGLVQMVLGGFSSTGKDWAVGGGTVWTWGIQLVALGWVAYTLTMGFFSLLALVWLGVNGLAALLSPVAFPSAMRASKAKRALYAD